MGHARLPSSRSADRCVRLAFASDDLDSGNKEGHRALPSGHGGRMLQDTPTLFAIFVRRRPRGGIRHAAGLREMPLVADRQAGDPPRQAGKAGRGAPPNSAARNPACEQPYAGAAAGQNFARTRWNVLRSPIGPSVWTLCEYSRRLAIRNLKSRNDGASDGHRAPPAGAVSPPWPKERPRNWSPSRARQVRSGKPCTRRCVSRVRQNTARRSH